MSDKGLETIDGDDESRERIKQVCDEFETAWRGPKEPSLSEYLEGFDGQEKIQLFQNLLRLDVDHRERNSLAWDSEEYATTFPEMKNEVASVLQTEKKRKRESTKSDSPLQVSERYVLEEAIGQGGMGTVHRARQVKPVQRIVAFKVIRAGMDSSGVLQRFEAERQALALMDHPNIAKVLDAGKTESGQPFFAMEFVDGKKITDYCSDNNLPLEDRLLLFVDICEAIEHAHRKGIIHRDIKPSNVLVAEVDDQPTVKVIDFGVAKAISQRLTEETINTEMGHLVGTPEYMSPEQASLSDLDVDTRSDVFALGVLLFELITSTTPIDSKHAESPITVLEILRHVRETSPPRVSQRLGLQIKASDKSTSSVFSRSSRVSYKRVERELDWIVEKSLSKEREERYQSVSEFAADVERFLNGEPINAHPPSAAYRVRKFISRHKVPVIASALILASLIMGIVGTSWGLLRAWEEAENAKTAHSLKSKALTVAVNNSQFAMDALGNIVLALNNEAAKIPGTEVFRRDILKKVYASLDKFSTVLLDTADADTAIVHTHIKLADLLFNVGDNENFDGTVKAEQHMLNAVDMAEHLNDLEGGTYDSLETWAHAVEHLVELYLENNNEQKLDKWLDLHLQMREKLVEQFPDEKFQKYRLLAALMDKSKCAIRTRTIRRGRKLLKRMELLMESFEDSSKSELQYLQLLSGVYQGLADIALDRNDFESSIEKLKLALPLLSGIANELPDDPLSWRNVAIIHVALGEYYFDSKQFESSEDYFRQAIQFHEKGVKRHPNRIDLRELLGVARSRLGEVLLNQNRNQEGANRASASH